MKPHCYPPTLYSVMMSQEKKILKQKPVRASSWFESVFLLPYGKLGVAVGRGVRTGVLHPPATSSLLTTQLDMNPGDRRWHRCREFEQDGAMKADSYVQQRPLVQLHVGWSSGERGSKGLETDTL